MDASESRERAPRLLRKICCALLDPHLATQLAVTPKELPAYVILIRNWYFPLTSRNPYISAEFKDVYGVSPQTFARYPLDSGRTFLLFKNVSIRRIVAKTLVALQLCAFTARAASANIS